MFKSVTPTGAIAFTRISVAFTLCWPLSKTANKFQVVCFKILKCIVFANAVLIFLPLLYTLYKSRNNITKFFGVASQALAVTQYLVYLVLFTYKHDDFQNLIDVMKYHCKHAKDHEKYVLEQYVGKYAAFYGTCAVWFYTTGILFIMGVLFTAQQFPLATSYPFPVDYQPLNSILFVQSTVVVLQCCARICVNIFCALLMLYSAAQFDVLRPQLRSITDQDTLVKCWKDYYAAKRYAQEVVSAIQYVALTMILIRCIVIIFCAIAWLGVHETVAVRVQLMFLGAGALLEVLMCAWPADKLMEVSENSIRVIYESIWYEQPLKVQKTLLCMLVPQKPVTVSVKCIIPALSINYVSSYLSSVFSFFTTLRVVINEES